MKSTPKPTLWIVLAALTWAGGAAAVFAQYSAYRDQVEEQKRLEKLVQSPESVEKERADSVAKLVDAKSRLEHLERSVPEFAYVPTLLKELEAFGVQNGMEVFGVRPMPMPQDTSKKADDVQRKKKPYLELLIEIKGRGRYENVMHFVQGLKTFPKIVAARAVSLTPKVEQDETITGKLDVTVELKTYVFPPTEADIKSATSESAPAPR